MRAVPLLFLLACPAPESPKQVVSATDHATCPVPSMIEEYPTVPNPYGEWPAADSCIAATHDAIVILGCPNDDDGTSSTCQEERVRIALAARDAGLGGVFVTTGGAVQNDYVEAETLKDLLVAAGVDPADIFTDPLAEHTDENLYYASLILEEQGFDDAIVVSDDPGQLVYTAVSDSNCCVDLGRLSVWAFTLDGGETAVLGHYALYPRAEAVTDEECAHIADLYMSTMLDSRLACADDFQL